MENENLVVTPKKNIGYYFVRNIWMIALYMIILILAIILRLTALKSIPEMEKSMGTILGIVLEITAIGTILIYLYMTIRMYLNTRIIKYVFYDTYVRYVDNFLNREMKTVSYSSISEVSMKQSIIDRLFNTGTIHLKTPVERQVGIYMNFVENPEAIEEKIRNLIINSAK